MGSFKSTRKTTESGTKTESGTTTPVLPGNLQTGLNGIIDKANVLQGQDPYSLVPGASALQSQAFGNAANLGGGGGVNWGGGQGGYGKTNSWNDDSGMRAAGSGGSMAPAQRGPDSAIALGAQNNYTAPAGSPGLTSMAALDGGGQQGGVGMPTNTGGAGSMNNGWQGGIQRSADLAGQVANAPANQADVYGYQAPNIDRTTLGDPSIYGGAHVGQAPSYTPGMSEAATLGQAQGYDPTIYGGATLGQAPQGTSQGFSAPQMGPAQGYSASQLGGAPTVGGVNLGAAHGYGASTAAAVNLDPASHAAGVNIGNAAQGASTDASGLISKFYNPYQQQVIDSSMADNAAQADRVRAQQMAAGAAGGAFGGSRFGIAQAQTEGELQRARDALGSGLRSAGYSQALGAAQNQAGQDTQVSMVNAQQRNAQSIAQGNISTQIGLGNAGFDNERNIAQGNINRDIGISNAGLQSRASEFGAAANNTRDLAQGGFDMQRSLAQADLSGRYALDQAGRNDQASQFTAGANNTKSLAQGQMDYQAAAQGNDYANRYGLANMDMQGQYGLAQAGYQQQAGLQGAQQRTDASRYNADTNNQFALTGAGFRQQSNLANQQAGNEGAQFNTGLQGQYGLAQAGYDQQAGLTGADTRNQFALNQGNMDQQRLLAQAGFQSQAAQFGAGALNSNSQFNAQGRDTALARRLQAAGLYGDLSNNMAGNARGDTALQAQLGDQQRQIEQQQRMAPYSQLQALGGIYGAATPMIGQNTTGNMNYNSTSKTTEQKAFMDYLMQMSQNAASAAAAGSDRRLKRNIERTGTTDHGLGLYRYNYHWDDPDRAPRTGVMADEVARIVPEALAEPIYGYARVNYEKLGLAHLVEA